MILYNKVREIIIKKLNKKPQEVNDKFAFGADLGADSLDMWEIITAIETQFSIHLEDSVVNQDTTVSELIKAVRSKVNAKNGKEPEKQGDGVNPQVKAKVLEVFSVILGGDIKPTSKVYDDLGADSLDVTEIGCEIEKFYNVCIDDEIFRNIDLTVQDVIVLTDTLVKRENKKNQFKSKSLVIQIQKAR